MAAIDYSCARSGDTVIRSSLDNADENEKSSSAANNRLLVDFGGGSGVGNEEAVVRHSHVVAIGNRPWITEKNFIKIPADVENKLRAQEELGHTAVLVAIDGRHKMHLIFLVAYKNSGTS